MHDRFLISISAVLLITVAMVGCDQLDPEAGQKTRGELGSAETLGQGQGHMDIDFGVGRELTTIQWRSADLGTQGEVTPLESGDLLFIRGNTWLSQLVASHAGDSTYTHVGIIEVDDNGYPWLIHAYPNVETLIGSSSSGVHRLPLDEYLSGDSIVEAVVYRLEQESVVHAPSAVAAARRYVEDGIPFDLRMELDCTERVYCSELVWRVYLTAGVDLVNGHFDQLHSPFVKGSVIYPSSLAASPMLRRHGALKAQTQE